MSAGSERVQIDQEHPALQKALVQVAIAARRAAKDAGLERRFVELINVQQDLHRERPPGAVPPR